MAFNHNNQSELRKEDLYIVDDNQLNLLRDIFSTETTYDVTLEETKEIGNSLLTLFKALAGNSKVTFGGIKRNIKPQEETS